MVSASKTANIHLPQHAKMLQQCNAHQHQPWPVEILEQPLWQGPPDTQSSLF